MPEIQTRYNKKRVYQKRNSSQLNLIDIIFQNDTKFIKVIIYSIN